MPHDIKATSVLIKMNTNANPTSKTSFDWRLLVAVIFFFYASFLIIVPEVAGISRQKLFHFVGVAALEFPLMDLRGVAAWCEASADGVDPAINPTVISLPDGTSKSNFLMNYSPVVLLLNGVGFSPSSVTGWGCALFFLQMAALLVLCGHATLKHAIIWIFLICSPLSILVMERANFDILVFALFVLALILRRFPLASACPILVAAILKFYPAAAFASLWTRGGRLPRGVAIVALLLILGFLFTLKSQLGGISSSLIGQCHSAFGCTIIADLLKNFGVCSESLFLNLSRTLEIFAVGIGVFSFVIGFFLSKRRALIVSERGAYAFWLTAPMFLALFILSNQMDYKWIFLLFMVPVALEICQKESGFWRLIVKLWISVVFIYSYWTFFSGEEALRNAMFKQMVMWIIFMLSAVMSGALWQSSHEVHGKELNP